ncbi:MAG: AAA family ATPase [Candidatus Altiarchaeota archaeon]
MRKIVGITGTPGTGKTTLSLELGRRLGYRTVDLKEMINKKLPVRFDTRREARVVDVDLLRKVFEEEVLTSTDDLIVDGLLSPFLPLTHIIVLRVNPSILKRRLEERKYAHEKIFENLEAEVMGVCLYDSLWCDNVLELDASGGADIARIMSWLDAGGKVVKEIDWFGEFESLLKTNVKNRRCGGGRCLRHAPEQGSAASETGGMDYTG